MRLKSLFGFFSFRTVFEDRPLLSSLEINELIAQAGSLKKAQASGRNQLSQPGDQVSTIIGGGVDFADRRTYVSGDDPRFIDWKASARSQQTLVKNYFTEVNLPACVVIDRRSSLAFGTCKRLKITQAIRIAITLGIQILRAGHPLACLIIDRAHKSGDGSGNDREKIWQPAQNSINAFRQTINFCARAYPLQEESEDKVSGSWRNICGNLKKHLPVGSRIILISDFFQLDSSDWVALQNLSHQYDLSAVQVIDQAEQVLPSLNNISLNFRQYIKHELVNSAEITTLNVKLQTKLQQQVDWFKKNNCHFIRVKSHDELTVLQGEF